MLDDLRPVGHFLDDNIPPIVRGQGVEGQIPEVQVQTESPSNRKPEQESLRKVPAVEANAGRDELADNLAERW